MDRAREGVVVKTIEGQVVRSQPTEEGSHSVGVRLSQRVEPETLTGRSAH